MSRRLSLLALVLSIGAGGADRLDAQARSSDPRSTLRGVVVDPSHAPLPDVAVVVEDLSRRMSHRAATDRQGRFEITDLPAGEFEAEVTVAGFAVFRERVRITDPLVEREIVLAIDALEETVTVVAGVVPANPDGLGRERGEVEPCVAPVDPETQSPIGGQVRPPRMLTRVPPAFPDHLREADLEGRVRLSGRISADGTLADVTLVEASHPDFAAAAEDAVRNWTWEEALLNCMPVDVVITVTVQFMPQRP